MATDFIIIHEGKIIEILSHEQLETKCERYVKIHTDDLPKCITVMEKDLEISEYKVIDDHTLHIYAIDNEIKLSYSRLKILLSKMIAVCTFAAIIHSVWIAANVLSFAAVRGFDSSVLCVENALWLITVLIQLSAVISGVMFITFITRTVAGAIAISSMYVLICCNILRNYTDAKIFTMSPFCFVQDNNAENLFLSAIAAFVTLIIFFTAATVIFHRSDVK